MTGDIDNGNHFRVRRQPLLVLFGHKCPELVHIDDGREVLVGGVVVVPHTNLTEVTRMVLIEVGTIFYDQKQGEMR